MAPYGSLWLPVVYHLDPSGIVQDQGPSLSSAWTKASKASILHIYSFTAWSAWPQKLQRIWDNLGLLVVSVAE